MFVNVSRDSESNPTNGELTSSIYKRTPPYSTNWGKLGVLAPPVLKLVPSNNFRVHVSKT